MSPSPTDRKIREKDFLFERPTGILLDEKQWLFLKDRYHMTPRELQIAILVCRGFKNNEIAEALKISHGTVKTHLRNLYRRVRTESKVLLLLKFVEDISKHYGPSKLGLGIEIKEIPEKPVPGLKTPQKS